MYSKEKYIEGFRRWLEMMNYVQSSIDYGPVRLQEFLEWLEADGMKSVDQVTGEQVQAFFEALAKRKSRKTGEPLSTATLRNYLTTINRFARYLRQSEQGTLPVPVQYKGQYDRSIVVLSKLEIQRLYQATDDSLLGIRDRAMLAIYYGCGARRNEGASLKISDILPDKNLLYIRKGKGYKERYVPMVGKVKKDILEYIVSARPMLLSNLVTDVFFIGITGKSLGSSSLYERFKKLVQKSQIEKPAGLHTLRHSIATHLLINGMKLSEIAKFLGHSSLESTQIYTHLRHEL